MGTKAETGKRAGGDASSSSSINSGPENSAARCGRLFPVFEECCRCWLAKPVSIQSLVAFRILFGMLMAAGMLRLLALGWVDELYVKPGFHFSYHGFEWVRPWPGFWMHAQVVALAGCALGIALGFQYRLCAGLFLLGFTHLELIDQANYLNHYYLVTLLSGLLLCLPAHRAYSIDAWRNARLRRTHVPAWTVNLLRFQVGIVYFFAGVAKLNADWLWRAQPLRIWLPTRADLPLIGPFLDEAWVAYAASWFGAAFDLSVPFLLMHRRTRVLAYFVAAVFHILTYLLFNIGMFPWIMLVSALVFFPPDWPRRLFERREAESAGAASLLARSDYPPVIDCFGPAAPLLNPVQTEQLDRTPLWQLALLCAYVLVQLVIPLRGILNAGASAWTCEGFNFAWKVMIVEKTGHVVFYANNPVTKARWRIESRDYLTPRQSAMMAQDPHLIRAMARRIAADLESRGRPGIEVRADAFATLNGRSSQRIIDPGVNLAEELPPDWIVPLQDAPDEERPRSVSRKTKGD